MSSEVLLARYADCLFWLARYIERAENLARILDVNETFSRDSKGAQNWRSIIDLHSDHERFVATGQEIHAANVLHFYITDADNPTSIAYAVRFARENARTLRPLISTEMWVQLNIFHSWVSTLRPDDLSPGQLNTILERIKTACQTHTGIVEGTFFRDQGWHFYQIGRLIERADQTTRLLDMKYHLLLPAPADVGSAIDISQWNTLLRSAAGYHAYRRVHPRGISPGSVTGFLLLNRRFPRSAYVCVREIALLLGELTSRFDLRCSSVAAEQLDSLHGLLAAITTQEILLQGLHEFLDLIQVRLMAVTRDLSECFFGHTKPEPLIQAA